MFYNILKTALRILLKNKSYAIINFAGLTVGIILTLLVVIYIRFETSYDTFQPFADRLYRITNTTSFGRSYALTPPALSIYLKDHFTGVEEVARMYERSVSVKRLQADQSFEEEKIFFTDSTIVKMMRLEFVAGDPSRALTEKFTIWINEEMARKYFGTTNPVGEVLLLGGRHHFTVTAVVKDFPRNAHLHFNMLVPYENMYDLETDENAMAMRTNLATNFVTTHSATYVLLRPGVSGEQIDAEMDSFIRKYAPPERQVGQRFSLMKVTDIHLHSALVGEPEMPNSLSNLLIFSGVGLLTLLMACINYINLATAQSFMRIKEIGMRKILGSQKYQLIARFFTESLIFCSFCFVFSIAGVYLCLPVLNDMAETRLTFQDITDPLVILSSLILLLLVTVLAGGYPAYFISQFKSVNSLKGEWGGASGLKWLRKGLVTFQLSIAIGLLAVGLLIMSQIDFMLTRPTGFQKEQMITIPLFSDNMNAMYGRIDSTFHLRLQGFRETMAKQVEIVSTSLSSDVPGVGGIVYRNVVPEGFTTEERLTLPGISIDYDFLLTYDMPLVAGRSFDQSFTTDLTNAFIVNESAIKEFKWGSAESAIGKTIHREYDGKEGQVIGVVKDFHFDVLTTPISGLLLDINPDQFSVLTIRFYSQHIPELLRNIETSWNAHFPEKSFQYNFLDEQLQREYNAFDRFSKIIQLFTLVAIVIAALGVYGLVLFTLQRKVKEIGVRKVLGATTTSILKLIYRDFILLVAIAFVLSVPVAYWLMNEWLKEFAYRTSIDATPFIISAVIVFVVMVVTISAQVFRASITSPIHSLKAE